MAPPPETVVIASPWTSELIYALFGGGALLIAAVAKALVELRSTKNAVVESRHEGQAAGYERDAKLDAISKSTNGNLSLALAEIASLKEQNEMLLNLLKRLSRGEIGPEEADAERRAKRPTGELLLPKPRLEAP